MARPGDAVKLDVAAVLLATPIFGDLTRTDVASLLPHLQRVDFARGETIWSEGDAAEALYMIAEGQVKSFRVSREGGELILEVASSGAIFGQVGVFHPSGVRRVCVSAMAPTVCLTLARDPLLAFLTAQPRAMRRMLESLSDLTGRAAYSLTDVAFEDIRRRVARTLLDLVDDQGVPTDDGVRIRLKLSQTTLAAMVAATRENVNRALAPFVTRGVISQREGCFVVHDRAALEDLSRDL